jgi:hypothetical protein
LVPTALVKLGVHIPGTAAATAASGIVAAAELAGIQEPAAMVNRLLRLRRDQVAAVAAVHGLLLAAVAA